MAAEDKDYIIPEDEIDDIEIEDVATPAAPKGGYPDANEGETPQWQKDLEKRDKYMQRRVKNYRNKAGEYEAEAEQPSKVDTSKEGQYLRQFIDEYKPQKPTEEELKQERTKRRIAALGDGLSALANFAGAAAGATPMQQPKMTLTEAQKKRFEEARKAKSVLSEKERLQMYQQYKALDELESKRIKAEQAAEEAEKKNKLTLAKEYRRQADKLEEDWENLKSVIATREKEVARKKKADEQTSKDRRRAQDLGASTSRANNRDSNATRIQTTAMNNAQSDRNSRRSTNQSNSNNKRNNWTKVITKAMGGGKKSNRRGR